MALRNQAFHSFSDCVPREFCASVGESDAVCPPQPHSQPRSFGGTFVCCGPGAPPHEPIARHNQPRQAAEENPRLLVVSPMQQQRTADQSDKGHRKFAQQNEHISLAMMRGDGVAGTEIGQFAHRGQIDRFFRRGRSGRLQLGQRRRSRRRGLLRRRNHCPLCIASSADLDPAAGALDCEAGASSGFPPYFASNCDM